MEAELKIVGAIVIGVMFLANTGIGIWIYRIMKASEEVKTIKEDVKKLQSDLTKADEKIRDSKQDILDKINPEREQRIKFESRIKQNEKEISELKNDLARNAQRFIEIAGKFESSISSLNTSMGHFSNILEEVKVDLKDIKNKG